MGNKPTKITIKSLSSHQAPLQQYQLESSGPNYYIWHNEMLGQSLIEYPFTFGNEAILQDQLESYLWRHRHYLLVSTVYINGKEQEDKYSIFYERVFTNLSRLKDLCFQDALQFYYVGLKGFQILYQRFGYFEVHEEMFHITSENKAKVWCDKNISRIYPATQSLGNQEIMTRKIIAIIDSNSDQTKMKIPIGNLLNRQPSITFKSALQNLKAICKLYKLNISRQLKCLQTLYKGKIQNMVDEYAIKPQKPQVKQTIQNKSMTVHSNHLSNTKISKTSSQKSASPRLMINSNLIVPGRQHNSNQYQRQYYSLPKPQSQHTLPQTINNNFSLGTAKVIAYPTQIPTFIKSTHFETKRPKSLQILPHSNRYFQRPPLIHKQQPKIQISAPKNLFNYPYTKRSTSNQSFKKSVIVPQNDQLQKNVKTQSFLKRSQYFIDNKKQQITKIPMKDTIQIKKTSKVNFKYVTPKINQNRSKVLCQTFIRQQIGVNPNINQQITEIRNINSVNVPIQKQKYKFNFQNRPKVTTLSSTLNQLQKKCQILNEKLSKTNMKNSEIIFPFKQIQPLQQNQLKIYINQPKINSLKLKQYQQLESKQEINISRQLNEEKKLANKTSQRKRLQTTSTIQSGKNLEEQFPNSKEKYNLEIKISQQIHEQIVLQKFPKQNEKKSKIKKYQPQIDDDIWNDMVRIKTKNSNC